MIKIVQTFPIRYGDEVEDPYGGLMNIRPKAADFYNQLFGLQLVAGKSTPLGEDESAFDEQLDAESLELEYDSEALDECDRGAGIAFLMEDLNVAKKVLAKHKLSIVKEASPSKLKFGLVADPDKSLIALFEATA
jgi:hypothetical protein